MSTSQPKTPIRLLSKSEMLALVGVSYSSIWNWIVGGTFPPGRALSEGKRGRIMWVEFGGSGLDRLASRSIAQAQQGEGGVTAIAAIHAPRLRSLKWGTNESRRWLRPARQRAKGLLLCLVLQI